MIRRTARRAAAVAAAPALAAALAAPGAGLATGTANAATGTHLRGRTPDGFPSGAREYRRYGRPVRGDTGSTAGGSGCRDATVWVGPHRTGGIGPRHARNNGEQGPGCWMR